MNGDDITKAAVAAREEAYREGVEEGVNIIIDRLQFKEPDRDDPYLTYQYYLGVAQAISNYGRSISGMNFGKGNDPQRKSGKA